MKADARPTERQERARRERADGLLRDIRDRLGRADAVTREDLLHLPSLDYVATITRYRYVGEAVRALVEGGHLVEVSRTELCLAGRQGKHRPAAALAEDYEATVERLAESIVARKKRSRAKDRGPATASVGEVVAEWATDEHLTDNVKRVVARQAFTALARSARWRTAGPGTMAAGE